MRAHILVLGTGIALSSVPASAQEALPQFSLERLQLDPAATGGMAIGSGDLLPEGGLRLAGASACARNPLVAWQGGQRLGAVVHNRWSGQLILLARFVSRRKGGRHHGQR